MGLQTHFLSGVNLKPSDTNHSFRSRLIKSAGEQVSIKAWTALLEFGVEIVTVTVNIFDVFTL